jgi:hypothetical protein
VLTFRSKTLKFLVMSAVLVKMTWAYRSERSLNPRLNFHYFIKHWYYNTYEIRIFGELADKAFSSCRMAVVVCELKWGRFGGDLPLLYSICLPQFFGRCYFDQRKH